MGLDTTHDAWHGAYSAFNRFRREICESIGGRWPDSFADDGNGFWYWGEGYSQKTHLGLFLFFCHSDCDGEFTPEECKLVADDLEKILPLLDDSGGGHIESAGGYKKACQRFIDGCRLAHSRGENLEFH
jgi:hypothetical protein